MTGIDTHVLSSQTMEDLAFAADALHVTPDVIVAEAVEEALWQVAGRMEEA